MNTPLKHFCLRAARLLSLVVVLFFTASYFCPAQTGAQPKQTGKIQGYKIYQARVWVQTAQDNTQTNVKGSFDSLVKIGTPQNFQVSLAGAKFELPVSMNIYKTGGTVDAISFEDVRVNGVKMEVEKFTGPFDFKKNVEIFLPRPLKISVPLTENAASFLHIDPLKDRFEVAGRVLVFGTFKKFGFTFKRAIPIDFNFKIKFTFALGGAG